MYASTDEVQGNIQEHTATQTQHPVSTHSRSPPQLSTRYMACTTHLLRDTSTSQYLTRQTNRQARGETQQHMQPPKPPLSICNIDANETNTVPHTCFSRCVALLDTSTLQYPPDERTDSQGETRQHMQPPKIPPSTIHNIHANNQIRRHTPALAVYDNAKRAAPAALLIPPPAIPTQRTNRQPGRNMAACAATQDPPQPSATYTPTTKYGTTPASADTSTS
ncbi:hypothetical protein BS47DRAFT_1360553 [Hydnum rufescens UP504]|uniref:Uncharacterized protein n=1 Tax=Hydnum rufescens UP504 TaxID=1448309 RepID=A0A9P6DYN6_9AGAM|nr:hypothetical protein BS47DRAFT_1360553 [Hydnum rufescens UP504]